MSKGLPPGPIANPGKKSLDAVLHSENTDYLYFVADKEGHNHFSKTYEEHLAAVHKIYGSDSTPSGNESAAQAAGPNYDVAAATTEPNYNYSSAEAVEADSQYVDVEPTTKYTPTTIPVTTAPEAAQSAPAATPNADSGSNYVPTTIPVTTPPESMQNVIPNSSQSNVPPIQVQRPQPVNPSGGTSSN